MTVTPIDKVLADGNCVEATNRGEETREWVRKHRREIAVGRILTEAASCDDMFAAGGVTSVWRPS